MRGAAGCPMGNNSKDANACFQIARYARIPGLPPSRPSSGVASPGVSLMPCAGATRISGA